MVTSNSNSSEKVLRVGVIGCGRMGKLHVRTYAQLPAVKLVGVYDAAADTAKAVSGEYSVTAFSSIEELASQVDAVTIATPTKYHLAAAEQCLNRKVACLIEKPLARDVEECKKIVELAAKNQTVVQVGHTERFNPAFRALEKLAIKPRFMEVTRISPMTFRSLDVGVVLDMMIHDIDLVLKLADSAVTKIDATGVSVLGDVEDICNARLTFASGCVANVTANRLALNTERKTRLYGTDAYVSVDYQKKTGLILRRAQNLEMIRTAAAKIRSGELPDPTKLNYKEMIRTEELQVYNLDPLKTQATAFADAVKNKARPVVTAEDGLKAVELATRIVQAIGNSRL